MGKLKLKFELEPQEETTYNYMAPEVFKFYKENAVSDQEHTYSYDETKADMWSLGFVLFRMLGETFPYNGPFKESLLLVVNTNLETLQLFPSIYFSCTERDPKKRPSAQQLLDNHF